MLRRSVNSATFVARANEYGGLKGSREFPDSYHTKSSNIDVAVASCHLSGRTIHISRFPTTALGAAVPATTVAVPASAETWCTWAIHPEGYPNVVALESFAEDVAAGTEGRIEP